MSDAPNRRLGPSNARLAAARSIGINRYPYEFAGGSGGDRGSARVF
jgi:hypothetical protein